MGKRYTKKDKNKRAFKKLFVIFLIHTSYPYLLHIFRRYLKYNLYTYSDYNRKSDFFYPALLKVIAYR